MKRPVLLKSLLFIAAFLSLNIALADFNRYQKELLESQERPTPTQILSKKSFLKDVDPGSGQASAKFLTNIPIIIVSLEKAFPGGTYAFLGRDMDLIADAVEAFYLSIGQKDRVARIRISTPSLYGATAENITDFLIQSGLNADPQAEKPPMVLVDYTSFSPSSQSTQIVNAVLGELYKRGVPANEVLKRFNIATINTTGVSKIDPLSLPPYRIEDRLKTQSREWKKDQRVARIVKIPVEGNVAYNSEWHDKYGPIVRDAADGTVATRPQRYFTVSQKISVLRDMLAAIKLATSEEFQQKVIELAAEHSVQIEGLDIPYIEPPQRPETIPAAVRALSAEVRKALADEKRAIRGEQVEQKFLQYIEKNKPKQSRVDPYYRLWIYMGEVQYRVSENASKLYNFLSKSNYHQSTHYFDIALNILIEYHQQRRIDSDDFRALFFGLMSEAKIYDMNFVEKFQTTYKNLPPLSKVVKLMSTPGEIARLEAVRSTANYNLRLLITPLALSCQKVLLTQ